MFVSTSRKLAGFFNLKGFLVGHAFYRNIFDIIGAIPVVGITVGVPRVVVGFTLLCYSPFSINPDFTTMSKRLMREGLINCVPLWNTFNFIIFNIIATDRMRNGLSTVVDGGQYVHVTFD